MEIIHLVYFVEVARQESFTKASEVLYVSQSTISKLIKNLENELGVALFHRGPKKIRLTDAGIVLYKKAEIILATLDSIHTELYALAGTPSGNLKIGIPPMVEILFSEVIAKFNVLYPQITIDLIEYGARNVENGIVDGTLDVGIVILPIKTNVELEIASLIKDPLMLILHPEHPMANQTLIDMNDLQHESFVLYREDFALREHILDKCKELGFAPKVVCETAQWDFMVDLVASKLAVAFLPAKVCDKIVSKQIKAIPIKNDIKPWHVALAWKNNTYLSYATKAWLHHTFKMFGISPKS
ncbi:MAG: LysR family transcriptional regulator [Syntrophomonas sp.]